MATRKTTRRQVSSATADTKVAVKQTREQLRQAKKLLRETARDQNRARAKALREFRRSVALLKRQGLVSAKIDARSVKPSKHLKRELRRWNDVLAGRAKAARPGKSLLQAYKAAGYRTKNGRVIMGVSNPRSRLHVGKKSITEIAPMINGSVEKISFPVPYQDVRGFLEGMKGHKEYDRKKTKSEKWAFQFFGRNSLATYDSIEDAIDDLDRYETIQSAIKKNDPEQLNEIYQNLVFYRVKRGGEWVRSPKTYKTRTEEQKRRLRERRERRQARMTDAERERRRLAEADKKRRQRQAQDETAREAERAAARQREAVRRASMSDEARQAYKDAARERAKAARNRKKGH